MPKIDMTITYTEEEVLQTLEEKAAKEIDMPTSGRFTASWDHHRRFIVVTFEAEPILEILILCKDCNGTGLLTDSNGVQKDEPCKVCEGIGSVTSDAS